MSLYSRSKIDYKKKYENLLKKWKQELVKNKILSDLNKGLNEELGKTAKK